MKPMLYLLLLLTVGIVPLLVRAEAPDTIYTNGKIYTVSEKQPWAEAVAIKDGKFIVVGKKADVEALKGAKTEVIDLGGKFGMPGMIDTHVHAEQSYKGEIVGEALLTFPAGLSDIGKMQ